MTAKPPFGVTQQLPDLAHAETEAELVARLYGGRALTRDDATMAKVCHELALHRLLHFATHGLMYEESPLMSGLALANGDVLTVSQLLGERLNADMVVLSACKTGLGKSTGGDEVLGLTRGLLAAGARSAVVSLWSVFDGSTSILMNEFHRRYKEHLDGPKALGEAQKALRGMDETQLANAIRNLRDAPREAESIGARTGGRHPRHWAPFIFIGWTKGKRYD